MLRIKSPLFPVSTHIDNIEKHEINDQNPKINNQQRPILGHTSILSQQEELPEDVGEVFYVHAPVRV